MMDDLIISVPRNKLSSHFYSLTDEPTRKYVECGCLIKKNPERETDSEWAYILKSKIRKRKFSGLVPCMHIEQCSFRQQAFLKFKVFLHFC